MPDSSMYDQPLVGQKRPSALRDVPALVWVLTAVIVVLAVVIGFLVADRNGADDAASNGGNSNSSSGAASHSQPADGQSAGQPDGQSDKSAQAAPGTNFDEPNGDPKLYGPAGTISSNEDIDKVHRRADNDPFARGALDAPVVISEFSDFECPFCSRFHNQTAPALIAEYVDKGLVRIEWNDFPVNGPHAIDGAKAGRAAAAQGKFAEFQKAAFAASADMDGHPNFDMDDYVRFAEEAGIEDIERFRQEAGDDTYTQVVEDARDYAASLGITGTPSFVVGRQFVSGAQPEDVFRQVIEEELSRDA
ncbi:DsbA family protein [Corynebacterium confusum]|uniref:DsbA family protein n=1 Tax=Corynebacterium confusum TaxID=71254 RepID=UPI0025B2DE90|nr:thioredoxin domain-containing protein [Corynebacterium confusum]WJY88803.1 Disulfide bond formation protein D precursor [Corynebacterium confusum]